MDRAECLAYLATESRCLAEETQDLKRELEAPLRSEFERAALKAFGHRLLAHRGLLKNHALALKWVIHLPG